MAITSQDFKIGLNDTEKATMANQITAETLNKLIPAFSTSVAYTKGQYTMYSNALYRFTADKSAGAWDSTKVESATLEDLIDDVNEAVASVNDKANVDGYYASMSVGLSDNFNTNMTTEDKSPYNFRTSGGALEIANQCKEKAIVGGSVIFNQLVQNGNFENTSNWNGNYVNFSVSGNIATFQGESNLADIRQAIPNIIAGHKYLKIGVFKLSSMPSGLVWFRFNSVDYNDTYLDTSTTNWQVVSSIYQAQNSGTYTLQIRDNSASDWVSIQIKNVMLIDLTQMFGSTIADYITTLETGQAGAGVAWFRKYFPNEYYAYNTGSFLNVKTTGKKVVGFNQWDEQWGNYVWNETANGVRQNNNSSVGCEDYIKAFPSTTYYFKCGKAPSNFYILFYDSNKNYIGYVFKGSNVTFTTPSNCAYITWYSYNSYGTTYNNDICINLHWDGERDGEYEPYEETTYPIENVELRGIPKLDSNNELYFDGDVYNADGSVEGRYTLIKAKNLGWNYYNNVFYVNVSNIAKKNMDENSNILSNSYTTMNAGYSSSGANKAIWKEQGSSSNTIYVRDDTYTDATTFINHFTDDDYILYELATPTTALATPFTEVQNVSNWGTEEFLDSRDVPMPVGHITEYLPDLKAKLETVPESPEDDGYYVMKRDNGENSYSLLSTWLTANGYIVPTSITGYDATKTQVLKNVEGVLTWVDEEV